MSVTTALTYRFVLCVLAMLTCMGGSLSGCASSTGRVVDGQRLDIPDEGPEPGALEAQALGYLVHITELLNTPVEEPHETVVAIGGFLNDNAEEIRETARQIEARIVAMTDRERVFYEERSSAYFAEANAEWHTSLDVFRQSYPRAAARIDGLMLHFD